ncbi:hypothetical protein MRX96_051362 [Rhipicephalus microplus]
MVSTIKENAIGSVFLRVSRWRKIIASGDGFVKYIAEAPEWNSWMANGNGSDDMQGSSINAWGKESGCEEIANGERRMASQRPTSDFPVRTFTAKPVESVSKPESALLNNFLVNTHGRCIGVSVTPHRRRCNFRRLAAFVRTPSAL